MLGPFTFDWYSKTTLNLMLDLGLADIPTTIFLIVWVA
jgi:hypothetical protein